MGRFLAVIALALGLAGALAVSAGSGGVNPEPSDGTLVLGVAGHDPELDAVTRGWIVAADPVTGDSRRRAIPASTLCGGPVLAVDGHAVFRGHRGRRAVARVLPLTLAGPARVLGESDTVTPLDGTGMLWLGRWRRSGKTTRLGLRQVSLDGEVLVRGRILTSRWSALHAALGRFFVVGTGRRLIVWDHFLDAPRRTIRDGWFLGAGASRFAWCRGRCSKLHVWSRRGERAFEPPPGVRILGPAGAFSPDGLRLATGVTVHGRRRVAVLELATGRFTIVPGSRLAGYLAIAWSPSGRWLYFTGEERRLLGFRHGALRAEPLPIEPGGTVMSIAST
jgi:hypothetical protein